MEEGLILNEKEKKKEEELLKERIQLKKIDEEKEKSKKKNIFARIAEKFKEFITGIADFFITLTLPREVKRTAYEQAVIAKEVYEQHKENAKDKETEIKETKEKDITKEQEKIQDKEILKDQEKIQEDINKQESDLGEKEKRYQELYEKTQTYSLGIELNDYIELVKLSKELDKEPKYVNITAADDRTYSISAYKNKDGEIVPSIKDDTNKDNKIRVKKKDMAIILESAKKVQNHTKPLHKKNVIPVYDFNKTELKTRLNNALRDNVFKDPAVNEMISKFLEQDNAYNMNIVYNIVSSQPDAAKYFGKFNDTEKNFSNLDPEITQLVLRMDYIEKMSQKGNFDLQEEIDILKTEFSTNKVILEEVLKMDISKYESLIQGNNTEIIFHSPDEQREISIDQQIVTPEYNNPEPLFNQITEKMKEDNIEIPELLKFHVSHLAFQHAYDQAQMYVDIFSKCPTESVDELCHTSEKIAADTGLKEHEAIFYDNYLYVLGIESIAEDFSTEPEIQEFARQEKAKFIEKMSSEYDFIYTEQLPPMLANIHYEINRIAESIGYQICEQLEEPIFPEFPAQQPEIPDVSELPIIEPEHYQDDYDYR